MLQLIEEICQFKSSFCTLTYNNLYNFVDLIHTFIEAFMQEDDSSFLILPTKTCLFESLKKMKCRQQLRGLDQVIDNVL